MQGHHLYWGDSHANIHHKHMGDLRPALEFARQMIDFWPMAYYPLWNFPIKGCLVEDWRPREELDGDWKIICDFAAAHNKPGELVVFPGYEWHGDATWGDHNVFFLADHPSMFFADTIDELYADIRRSGLKAYAIPHHTGYLPGVRSKNWDHYDEELSPFTEIFSVHGCSESDEEWIGLRHNQNMGTGVSGGTAQDGLARGYRLGIICSNDSHDSLPAVYRMGTMACYAKSLTREALWEAMAERRVYGVTGDRIELDFSVESAAMGSVIRKSGPVRCLAKVRCTDALDRIELLRNNRVIATHCHQGTWDAPAGPGRIRCKLRVEAGWNASPKWTPDLPPRAWDCSIEVPDGAVVGVEKCWQKPGQRVAKPGGRRCEFGFTTQQIGPEHMGLHTEATVFELEGRPGDTVRLVVEGKAVRMTLGEAMSGSRVVHFMEENTEYFCTLHGLTRAELPRFDRMYYYGPKAKLHRAIPEAGLVGELDFVDRTPPSGGRNHYRVRVSQRNGQVAWSSPVWVES